VKIGRKQGSKTPGRIRNDYFLNNMLSVSPKKLSKAKTPLNIAKLDKNANY